MNFDFSEDQLALRSHANRFLAKACGFDQLRNYIEGYDDYDRNLWEQMVAQGWNAISIPESCGGMGLGALELCVLAEEAGRVLAPTPFFGTVCLAAELLKRCDEAVAGPWLRRIAEQGAVATVDVFGEPVAHGANGLDGDKTAVMQLGGADFIIVNARADDGTPLLALIESNAAGVTRTPLPRGLDDLLTYGALQVRHAPAVVLAQGPQVTQLIETVRDQAAVITAFEQIGGAEAACAMSREYVLQRHAFGRPVGGYQAVKHKLADMMVEIELARANAYFGAWAMAEQAPELPQAAAAARLSATEAFNLAAEENLHLHGGIGYTWEANCHFFYKRARTLAVSLGPMGEWGERLLAAATATAA